MIQARRPDGTFIYQQSSVGDVPRFFLWKPNVAGDTAPRSIGSWTEIMPCITVGSTSGGVSTTPGNEFPDRQGENMSPDGPETPGGGDGGSGGSGSVPTK